MCRPLTRRELLRYGALVAATFPAARLLEDGWRLSEAHASGTGVPMHLELVTVTDTEAAMTWFTGDPTELDEFQRPAPVAMPGRVLLGTDPNPLTWTVVDDHSPTPYHHVHLTGLEPGRTYWWRAESAGVPATPTTFSTLHPDVAAPPSFTTLRPPPGDELLRVAWLNDLHIGEMWSGLAISDDRLPRGGFPPGFPADPEQPYWRTMAVAAITESAQKGCSLLLANGDLTAEARPHELEETRSRLDAFGSLGRPAHVTPGGPNAYFVTRGNHDRAHGGSLYEDCPPSEVSPDLYDCFREAFADSWDPGTSHFSITAGSRGSRYRFVGLDSADAPSGSGYGVMPQSELDYLEAELERGDPTIPLFHHPAGDVAILTGFPPGLVGLSLEDSRRFQEVVDRHPNVVGVYNGHTHRNWRTVATQNGDVPYFEGGAVKEYPGGYTTVRLYENGYMVNFWKAADPEARAWSERSRGEYLGLYPYYTLGSLGDRNWTHTF